jgi:hypothetical protein
VPISDTEWNDGVRADSASATATTPVGEYEDEKELIVAFLSENVDNAYTETESVRGVDFGNDARPETIREVLTGIQDELVAEGMIAEKGIATPDGTATYYRLNTDEARE